MSSQPFAIRGWCPGALRPMASGDGLVVRVRSRGGRLSAAQGTALARAALDHGNGEIDLSARANLQLRGVTEESHRPLLSALAALGLLDTDAAAESRRNIVVTPLWHAGDDIPALAARLEAVLAEAPPLPGKFGLALDAGAAPVLQATPADIRIERDETGHLLVRADGAPTGRLVTASELDAAVLELARWFVAAGGVTEGRGRMARLLARGAELPAVLAGTARPAPGQTPPAPGPHALGRLVGFPFGRLRAETLAALAAAGSALRLTPWRMILVEDISNLPLLAGMVSDADDPRLRVEACSGAPACPQALAPVRDLALALAPSVPVGRRLHVSACAKGCAHPAATDAVLTATPTGFDLARGARAGDPPRRRALSPHDLLQHPEILFDRP